MLIGAGIFTIHGRYMSEQISLARVASLINIAEDSTSGVRLGMR